MQILQLFRCALGRHRRNKRHAKFDGDIFRTRCIGCGRPMVRGLDGWRLEQESDHPGEPQS